MEINQEAIEEAIIKEAVRGLVANDDLYGRLQRGVDERIQKIFAETADAKLTESVNKAVQGGFEREYFRIDRFGKPIGEKTTIMAELEKLISDYWKCSVDSRTGKPSTSSYHSVSRSEWHVMQLANEEFSSEMKQHIANVSGALKDGLRSELHETVNKLLSGVFRVRSQGDKK